MSSRLRINPAYTIGKSPRKMDDGEKAGKLPGPQSYSVTTKFSLKAIKGGKIGTEVRDNRVAVDKDALIKLAKRQQVTPGPHSYSVKFKNGIGAGPSYHFQQRVPNHDERLDYPAPNQYKISSSLSNIAFSMAKKNLHSTRVSPGPGSYHDSVGKDNWVKGASIGLQTRFRNNGTSATQPGSPSGSKSPFGYNVEQSSFERHRTMRSNSPCFGAKSPNRELSKSSKLITPGPSDYTIYSVVGRKSSAFSIGKQKRLTLPRKGSQPGPCEYSPEPVMSSALRRFPAYSICKSPKNLISARRNTDPISPGPCSYSLQCIPKSGFGVLGTIPKGQRELQKELREAIPGPAEYITTNPSNAGPKYLIGCRTMSVLEKQRLSNPGVGEYNLAQSSDCSSTIKQMPKFKFGSEARITLKEKEGPGPLAYEPEKVSLKKAPRAVIPQAKRLSSAKTQLTTGNSTNTMRQTGSSKWLLSKPSSPGPGEYFLPATFGRQAAYARVTSSAQFQRV